MSGVMSARRLITAELQLVAFTSSFSRSGDLHANPALLQLLAHFLRASPEALLPGYEKAGNPCGRNLQVSIL